MNLKKRLLASLMTAVTVFSLLSTGLVVEASNVQNESVEDVQERHGYKQPERIEVDFSEVSECGIAETRYLAKSASVWQSYGSSYYYNQMSSAAKSFYDKLNNMCMGYLTTSTDNLTNQTKYVQVSELTLDEAETITRIFIMSNPQYYFLRSGYCYASNGSDFYISILVYPLFNDGATRASYTAQMESKIDSWLSVVNTKSTKLQKETAIRDILVANVDYVENEYDQSCFSTFILGQTVCAGYAQAFELLCNAVGIPTICVTSWSHEWNKVYIGGKWYNVDCTWEDAGVLAYDMYFNVSDNTLWSLDPSGSHELEQWWGTYTVVPGCYDDEVDESVEENVVVSYQTHVQDYGWQGWVSDGAVSGTSGQSKRLEGINITVSGDSAVNISYRTHVQDYGWQDWVSNGEMSGTSGQSKRLEAIQIKLTGNNAGLYDVYYRVHAQDYGWLDWAMNGNAAGTEGLSKRLEAIQIVVVLKGTNTNYITNCPFVSAYGSGTVRYATHVQDYGWQSYVNDGEMSGTSGQSKRLEGIQISLSPNCVDGGILYQTHVQDYGWQGWTGNGGMSGTCGESKRLEAIRIQLTGEMAEQYDVYYRVHVQDYGWLDWASNGQMSGTSGQSKRLEGIQIVLVPKGGNAPGSTARPNIIN